MIANSRIDTFSISSSHLTHIISLTNSILVYFDYQPLAKISAVFAFMIFIFLVTFYFMFSVLCIVSVTSFLYVY